MRPLARAATGLSFRLVLEGAQIARAFRHMGPLP